MREHLIPSLIAAVVAFGTAMGVSRLDRPHPVIVAGPADYIAIGARP